MENIKSYFNFSRQALLLLGVLFLVVIGIAATVLSAQQQQEIRKRAEGENKCVDFTDDKEGACGKAGCSIYNGIEGPKKDDICSIGGDDCLTGHSFNQETCEKEAPKCAWHPKKFCYTKNQNPQPPPPQQVCIDISAGPACENNGCQSYGLDGDKNVCSIKEDKCIRLDPSTCDLNKQINSCEWHNERGFCYTKQQQAPPPPPPVVNPPSNNGDNKILPVPSTSCRVRWDWDPNPETSPANTSFRAYIKGQSATNNDWRFIGLKFDAGNLGAISDIKTSGSLGPLTNCSTSQPCFQSNVLNSGAANSDHTLTFSINNPDKDNPNPAPINCTPPQTFKTAGGGTITPPPGGDGGTGLLMALNLEGFPGTYTPKRETEPLIVLLRSQNGTLTAVETVATFSAFHRHFRKKIDLPSDLADGIYELLLKGASTLRRTFGNVTIAKNRETFVPFDPNKPLLACDLNNDNLINILDLNTIYTDIKKPKTEHKDSLADITRDGVIDIFDHNYCVQNFDKEGEKP